MMKYMKVWMAALGLGAVAAGALAQSFNVDLNLDTDPELGGGAPSDAFGAATNIPGKWNAVLTNVGWTRPLVGLDGLPTTVTMTCTAPGSAGSGGGFRFEGNTGDYAKLLNDANDMGFDWTSWTFNGLQPGQYRLYTYAVKTWGGYVVAPVEVLGASPTPLQYVTGPMPGNAFGLYVTHSIHEVTIYNSSLTVTVRRSPTLTSFPHVNGFQLVAVPEPATLLVGIPMWFVIRATRKVA